MPLLPSFQVYHAAVYDLIQILEDPEIRKLRNTDTVTIRRLINLYPETPQNLKPALLRDILNYYWKPPFQNAILNTLEKFEKYLLSLGKREHFIHQFEVMLLGLNILHLSRNNILNVKEIYGFEDWRDVYYTWTITSMGHDFGYPYEIATELMTELSSLYGSIGMMRVSENLEYLTRKQKILSEDKLLSFTKQCDTSFVREIFDNNNFLKEAIKTEPTDSRGGGNYI
jgi:hypothetical protein